ncbi:MAG: PhoD-like phosphatase N-terminal domain-containing protein, partial [Longimicrobiales bacterium]|nr:PhoD-like phosphatase N-terminal domain-containing protein [Longimicrobiales bacterium]
MDPTAPEMDGRFWFELFGRRATRRDFLRLGAGAAGVVALGGLPGCGAGRAFRAATHPFTLGVASGDPSPDGVVLWTRLDRMALEAAGAHHDVVEVRWELAEDEGLRRIVRTGSVDARPELGHSAHVELAGLGPGRDYFYRFLAGGEVSAVGRTRTAPEPDADNPRLDFAFLSCQHYEHGYYTALRHLAGERLDLVI